MNQVLVVGLRPTAVKVKSTCSSQRPRNLSADAIQVREADNTVVINGVLANIHHYDIIVPGKVMKITFVDGTSEKTVLKEGDTFSVEAGLRIAIAKHVGKRDFNLAGIENLATRLSYLKCIDKMINKTMREYDQNQKQLKKLEENQREIEAAKERRARKAAEKKARRAAERNQCNCKGGVDESSCKCQQYEGPRDSDEARQTQYTPAGRLNITRSPHNTTKKPRRVDRKRK